MAAPCCGGREPPPVVAARGAPTAFTTWSATSTSGSTTSTGCSPAASFRGARRRAATLESAPTRASTSTTASGHGAASSSHFRYLDLGSRRPRRFVGKCRCISYHSSMSMDRGLRRHRSSITGLLLLVGAIGGCGHPMQKKLEGRWLGDSVENFDDDVVASATGWAKGASMEFAG